MILIEVVECLNTYLSPLPTKKVDIDSKVWVVYFNLGHPIENDRAGCRFLKCQGYHAKLNIFLTLMTYNIDQTILSSDQLVVFIAHFLGYLIDDK